MGRTVCRDRTSGGGRVEGVAVWESRQEGGREGRKGGRKDSVQARCDENMSEWTREGACPGE